MAAALAAKAALDAAKTELGITSPSAEFVKIGQSMMTGLVKGIESMQVAPAIVTQKVAEGTLEMAGATGGRTIIIEGNLVVSPEALLHRDFVTMLEEQWRNC